MPWDILFITKDPEGSKGKNAPRELAPCPALQAGQNNLQADMLPPGDPLAAAGSMIILRT